MMDKSTVRLLMLDAKLGGTFSFPTEYPMDRINNSKHICKL